MADAATPVTETNADPVFQIQRVYLKEASLEQPNSPAILLAQEQPEVNIQLGVDATPVADGVFEVTVTATVHTKIGEKTVFLVEAKQAGIFEIRNLQQNKWAPSWASPALRLCTRTCAATWQTSSPALAFRLCIWRKSTSKPCTSSSKRNKLQRRCNKPFQLNIGINMTLAGVFIA